MTLRLRAAGDADVAPIMAVMATAFDPRFGEAWSASQVLGSLASRIAWAKIAELREHPVGFTLCRRVGPEAELLLIGVVPASRGQGIGFNLLTAAKRDARVGAAAAMFLEVREDNGAALALYRRADFAVIGRRRDYYRGIGDTRFDAITLRSDLAE
jgi:ribosomal-protein-alanine N-acetyltransferase